MKSLGLMISVAAAAMSAQAISAPAQDFHALMDQYWATGLRESPLLASEAGVRDYDAELDEVSTAAMDRKAGEASAFLKRLDSIQVAALSAADQSNFAILRN